jgi:hypothetical protein
MHFKQCYSKTLPTPQPDGSRHMQVHRSAQPTIKHSITGSLLSIHS